MLGVVRELPEIVVGDQGSETVGDEQDVVAGE
jgi:hypothetical protein